MAAGTRAVQMLKQVVISVRMVPIVDSVPIPSVSQLLGEDGQLHATEAMDEAAARMLAELARLSTVLTPLQPGASFDRGPRPGAARR